jgi:HEAT repeat protein
VLADDMAGSDLMAAWSCRSVHKQSWNSDSANLKAIGGIIDDAAKGRLRPLVLRVLERKDSNARAAAVRAIGVIFSPEKATAILKPMLKGEDVRVAAAVVTELELAAKTVKYDKEIDDSVWRLLAAKDDPDLIVACCEWWQFARQRNDMTITPEQEARFADLANDSHPMVRYKVSEAVAEYATADHPVLVSFLLKMATTDKEPSVRCSAVNSLRHAKTQAVYRALTGLTTDPQSLVRTAAQRALSEGEWVPATLQED